MEKKISVEAYLCVIFLMVGAVMAALCAVYLLAAVELGGHQMAVFGICLTAAVVAGICLLLLMRFKRHDRKINDEEAKRRRQKEVEERAQRELAAREEAGKAKKKRRSSLASALARPTGRLKEHLEAIRYGTRRPAYH